MQASPSLMVRLAPFLTLNMGAMTAQALDASEASRLVRDFNSIATEIRYFQLYNRYFLSW